MNDSHNLYQGPDAGTDPWYDDVEIWPPQPFNRVQQPAFPYNIRLPEEDAQRIHPHASGRDRQQDFQNVLPGSQPSQLDYRSFQGRDGDAFVAVDRNAAQSYAHYEYSYDNQQPRMNASRHSMQNDTIPRGGHDWPHASSREEFCTCLNCSSGVNDDSSPITPLSSVLHIPGIQEQAVLSGMATITSFPVHESEQQWNCNGPQPSVSSTTTDPWSQYARPMTRPSNLLDNQSRVWYGQRPGQTLSQANVPPVGNMPERSATNHDQNVGVSPSTAQECHLGPSTPAIQVLRSFADHSLADDSSSEEAGSPDTGLQEIVFDIQSGETVVMKEKRVVPEDRRAESQWIRKNGGSCAACRRGKRKCEPSHKEGRSSTTQASSATPVSGETSPWVVVDRQTSSSTKRARERAYGPTLSPSDPFRHSQDAVHRPINLSTSKTVSDPGPAMKRPRTLARRRPATPDSASITTAGVPDYSSVPWPTSGRDTGLDSTDLPRRKASFSEAKPGLGAQFMTDE